MKTFVRAPRFTVIVVDAWSMLIIAIDYAPRRRDADVTIFSLLLLILLIIIIVYKIRRCPYRVILYSLPVDYYFLFSTLFWRHPVDICCCTPDNDTRTLIARHVHILHATSYVHTNRYMDTRIHTLGHALY